jgi:PAS domain S-box-containing protein
VIDQGGSLRAIGTRLQRFVGFDSLGVPLTDWFDVESPPEGGHDLHRFDGELVAAIHRGTGLSFRGQVVADVEGLAATDVVLAWSPWISSMEDFKRYSLTLADFGAHDSTIDVLHLLQATQSAQRDAVAPLERLQRFFTLADDALLVLDATGRIRQANESCRITLAGPEASVTGRSLLDYAVGDGPALLGRALGSVCDNEGSTVRIDADLRRADGIIRRFRLALVADSHHPSTPAGGENAQRSVYAIARDVTEEDEQRRATELVLDGAPIAMLVTTPAGIITYVNEATCRLFGHPRSRLIDSPVEMLLPPELREVHTQQRQGLNHSQEAPRTRAMGQARRVVGLTAHGEHIELEITLNFVSIRGGRRVVASVVDVRARKALERQLREARDSAIALAEAKSSVLANTSHEIRTPLTSVLGLAELLLDTDLSDDQRDMVSTMRAAGDRLLSLVNDILTLARSESGHLTMDVRVFSPAELVTDCIRVVSPQTSSTSVRLALHIDPSTPPLVRGDPEKLRGVLLNLLGNAVKFTAEGEVRLDVAPTADGLWRFSVTDTGIGIPESALPHLFEPFVQADITTTRRFGGSGLGLAIAEQLVRMMDGRIEVSSTLGRGSRFSVIMPLPVPADAVPYPLPSLPPPPISSSTESKVLLVEDDRINSMILQRMLSKLGMSVVQAHDGSEAMQKMREHEFDVVLMDCHMPIMDGLEATRRIRAGEAGNSEVPIVALTAAALDEDRRRCLDAGMDDFLSKPVRPDEILEVMSRVSRAPKHPTG